MATTPKLGLTLLDVGQKQKEATINDAFNKIDAGTLVTEEELDGTTQNVDVVISPASASGYTATFTSFVARSRPIGTAGYLTKYSNEDIGSANGGYITVEKVESDGSLSGTQDGSLTIKSRPFADSTGASITLGSTGTLSFTAGTGALTTVGGSGGVQFGGGAVGVNFAMGVAGTLKIDGDAGSAGQVLSSNGAGARNTWMSIPQYLGDAASDPATSFTYGSTYYNTTTSKLKVLRASGWSNAA